jgi:membrane associated rhomboid family serine protease
MEAPRLTCYRHPNRETGVSCGECGRGLCPDCMVFTPVGIKCAEHAGVATGAARVVKSARQFSVEGGGMLLTKILVGVNVLVFLWQVGSGGTLTQPYGYPFQHGALVGVLVANGDWWRLVTAMFLHGSIIHLGTNMLFLWWIGGPVEQALGRARFALLYFVSGLSGGAGVLLFAHYDLFDTTPLTPTVGASGALFGILGAALVFERQRVYVLGGSALGIIVLNFVFTFTISNISVGGHIGGLIGGALAGLALSRFGQAHAAYGRPGVLGIGGVVAVGILSVAVAYWSVAPYA